VCRITSDKETPTYTWDSVRSRYSKYLIADSCEGCELCFDIEKKSTGVAESHKLPSDFPQNPSQELDCDGSKDQPRLQRERKEFQPLEAPSLSAHRENQVKLGGDQLSTKDGGQVPSTYLFKDSNHKLGNLAG
jgi:hypothetical protein